MITSRSNVKISTCLTILSHGRQPNVSNVAFDGLRFWEMPSLKKFFMELRQLGLVRFNGRSRSLRNSPVFHVLGFVTDVRLSPSAECAIT